jgi:lipopolysaccharide export system permease protein
MLNIKELKFMEDSLGTDYYKRLKNFFMEINLNPLITQRVYNLMTVEDSLKRDVDAERDSTFNFNEYFSKQNNWIKAEIAQAALENARNNVQVISMHDDQLYNRKKYLNRYSMEKHRKYTLSIAVLIFFFIGAPLGAIIRKGGLGMPVVVSILLFIAYYVISMTGEKSAREDVWDMFAGMWFSTFMFFPIGIWLSYKAATDAALMNAETYTKLFGKLGLEKLFEKLIKKR